MMQYEIKGKGKDTGRKRKRVYIAKNEQSAIQLAEADGIIIDEIKELPPDPPTERQLDYAKDLGIAIPPDATKDDVSNLISIKVNKDKLATERYIGFARRYGIDPSRYVGKKALFDQIQAALIIPGKEKDLTSWFIFRVYRELVNGADDAQIKNPDDPIIQEIANQLESDEKFIKSVRRYEGRDLIWFGEWTTPDGYMITGGSNRTEAYKTASSLLREKVGIPVKSTRNTSPNQEKQPSNEGTKQIKKEPKGCLPVIALVMIVPLGFYFFISWLRQFIA